MRGEKTVQLYPSAQVREEYPDHIKAAAFGIADVLTVQGYSPRIVSAREEISTFIGQLEQQNYNSSRGQLSLESYWQTLGTHTDMLRTSRPDFVLSGLDLYAENTNFVFGVTIPEMQVSVQSIARYIRMTRDESVQLAATRHIARHEYAHIAGMNDRSDYRRPDTRGGIYEGHCMDECTMQQVMNTNDVLSLLEKLDGHELAGFCVSCVSSLRRK